MNNRLLKTSKARPATARRHVATVLTQEILDNPATTNFRIESEYQLCRRFGISRVTVRLVLSDLENRGLIYRKHGKGTFAHGRSTRIYRHIGILIKSPLTTENRPLAEILRGAQTFVHPLRSGVILISQSPEEWRPELTGILSGVIVVAENVTTKDLDNLKNRKLPFFIVGKTDLPGPRIIRDQEDEMNLSDPAMTATRRNFFAAGHLAAAILNRAFLTGEPQTMSWDATKNKTETDQGGFDACRGSATAQALSDSKFTDRVVLCSDGSP
jgi:ribosomal protein S25